MTLKKSRFGFSALIVSGLLAGISYFPQVVFAQELTQTQTGFENMTKQSISVMPNNSLLKLKRQLKLLSQKQSLPANYRAAAKAKIPLVNAEIKRRGIGRGTAGQQQRPSQDVLSVLHNFRDSSRLTNAQLKQRLVKLERLIDARGVKKKWKRKARVYRSRDSAELQRRRDARVETRPNPPTNNRNLLAVLKDRRPLSSLNKRQLQQRILRLQAILSNPNVAQRHINKASRLKEKTRAELKRRRTQDRTPVGGNNGAGGHSILAVLNDQRRARSLNDTQLLRRMARLERVIDGRGINKKHKRRARLMRAKDQAEHDRRRRTGVRDYGQGNGSAGNGSAGQANASNIGRVLNDRRLSRDLSDSQLLSRLSRLERVIDARGISPRWKARARQMRVLDQRERTRRRNAANPRSQNPNDTRALAVLNDQRPSQRLNRAQLTRRIARLDRLIDSYGIERRYISQARSMRRRDQAELQRRRQPTSGADDGNNVENNRLAQLMADRRLARNLSDSQLRARVGKIRRHMRRREIGPELRSRLSRKLAGDRLELRRRVAAQNNPYEQGQNVAPGSRKLAIVAQRLLNDNRSARQLSKKQLRKRIRDAREVLLYAPLPRPQINQVKRMIKADRVEKKSRLLAARERRRLKLQNLRRQGRLRFDVAPQMRAPQGSDISGAEANDRMIRRQFLAKDGRSVARKYSRAEVARRPELTRRFGGIDIDTIKFGFNEYWVREEEVDEIERMAITIERILAARPYEVFQIEGHTDAVGSDRYNLGLSRQRATAVKDALTKYFLIPPSALVTVGLGERYLKIPTEQAESENRRVTVRRITPLLR